MNMYDKRVRLKELMRAPECTPLMGAYDVLSAKIIEQTGFPVVYTGSLVTGASAFGLPDVGLVQLADLLGLSREIAKEVDLPIVCDADSGWYHAGNIWRTVHEFESAGVSAIHIEDQIFGKHTDQPALLAPIEQICDKIRACCDARVDPNFMIIARTDALYLQGDADAAIERANAYLAAGADAAFVVFKNAIADETAAGVNMSVYWPLTLFAASKAVRHVCELFRDTRDASKLQEYCFDEGTLNELLPYDRFDRHVEKYDIHEVLKPQAANDQ